MVNTREQFVWYSSPQQIEQKKYFFNYTIPDAKTFLLTQATIRQQNMNLPRSYQGGTYPRDPRQKRTTA